MQPFHKTDGVVHVAPALASGAVGFHPGLIAWWPAACVVIRGTRASYTHSTHPQTSTAQFLRLWRTFHSVM